MVLAPIVIFCYNRPSLLKQTVDALLCNSLAIQSDLIIYCDGPKSLATVDTLKSIEEVRLYSDSIQGFKSVLVVKSDNNKGLQTSVIEGLNKVFECYESAIIVEDDVVTSPFFLDFMNKALVNYKQESKILSIGSWNYYYETQANFFNHMPDTIAWATWKDRWALFEPDGHKLYNQLVEKKLMDKFNLNGNFNFENMLVQQFEGKVSSWAIRWTALAVLKNTVTLYPKISLSKHIGFGIDSTNCDDEDFNINLPLAQQSIAQFDIEVQEDKQSIEKFIEFEKSIKKSPATTIKSNLFSFQKIKSKLMSVLPYRVKKNIKKYFVNNDKVSSSGWFGDYVSWNEALKHTSGYNETSILNKIKESTLKVISGEAEFERDSVAFDIFEYSPQLLNAFKATVENNKLSVIDFGGSLGSQYFQYKRFFEDVNINWMVVEQSHFVDCGRKEIANEQLQFFYTIEEAIKYKSANTIILSSVLPYIEKPFELIEKIISYQFEYIIIDRNPFINLDRDLISVQIVPESVYKASYPAWFFNEEKFLKLFLTTYQINQEINSPFAAPLIINNQYQASWKGFILKRKL